MATTRSTRTTPSRTVSRKEFEAAIAQFQKADTSKAFAQNPVIRAWSSFFYSFFSNPKTTLAGIGAAIPVLHEAYQTNNPVLAIAGLSTVMTGALAGDASNVKKIQDHEQDT